MTGEGEGDEKPGLPDEQGPAHGGLFNPHEASRAYASGAAVLAGFCFAAVVLVVTIEQGVIATRATST